MFYEIKKKKVSLHCGSAIKARPVLFYVARFDLSDRDKFFDSKTRSSIVSIGFSRRVVAQWLNARLR